MTGIQTRDVVQKGNLLDAILSVTNYKAEIESRTSPEFVFSGAAKFQVLVVQITSDDSTVLKNMIFVSFNKQKQANDDLIFVMKLTSTELSIKNKCFTSDDGTWHLVHENRKQNFTFDVHVAVEVVPSPSSFATLHDDTELTDFELRGEDGSVHMHRAVMAAASPVLFSLMAGSWKEETEGSVDVPGTSQATLQHFKDYLYLHTLPELGIEQLLLLASYYMIPDLEQKCVDKLVYKVSAGNACDMIMYAAKHKLQRLLLTVLECVQNGVVSVADMRAKYYLNHTQTA